MATTKWMLMLALCQVSSAQGGFSGSVTCPSGLKISIESKTEPPKDAERDRDTPTVEAIRESQKAWENYREKMCAGFPKDEYRLMCEQQLTRVRMQDLELFVWAPR